VAGDPATANRIRGVGSPISGSGVNVATVASPDGGLLLVSGRF